AGARCIRVFGIFGRQRSKIFAALQAVIDHADLFLGLGVGLRFVGDRACRDVRLRAVKNVSQGILWLPYVELDLMLVVIILNISVGNRDFGSNLLVQEFVDG